MIVLSDTSPINYLILTDQVDVLPALFAQVIVPAGVLQELQHSGTPEPVRRWISQPPTWITIRAATSVDPLLRLGRGEAEAISLAVELKADLLLMDDRRGRREAQSRGITVAGTLNILVAAASANLVDLPTAVAKLRATNFHIAEKVLSRALQADVERKRLGGT